MKTITITRALSLSTRLSRAISRLEKDISHTSDIEPIIKKRAGVVHSLEHLREKIQEANSGIAGKLRKLSTIKGEANFLYSLRNTGKVDKLITIAESSIDRLRDEIYAYNSSHTIEVDDSLVEESENAG